MPKKSELTQYQDALLELLSSRVPQEEILEKLENDPRFEHYREYVKEFDPDMVAVACELMGKWAKRRPERSNSHTTKVPRPTRQQLKD